MHAADSGQSIDTENANAVKDITINGCKGIYVIKKSKHSVFWADEVKKVSVSIHADSLLEDELFRFAEGLVIK